MLKVVLYLIVFVSVLWSVGLSVGSISFLGILLVPQLNRTQFSACIQHHFHFAHKRQHFALVHIGASFGLRVMLLKAM